jgi:urea transporter
MPKAKWSKLTETNAVCSFVDTLLRGYGQIIFCNHTLTGLIVLIGFLDSPISGILSLIGSISALITAILIRSETYLVKSGLFGCNGALIGFALALYLPVNLILVLIIVLVSILAAILMKFLINTLSAKFNLPVLSIPFVVVTWLGLLSARFIPDDPSSIPHRWPNGPGASSTLTTTNYHYFLHRKWHFFPERCFHRSSGSSGYPGVL